MTLTPSQARAIAHVERAAEGGPLDPELRVTLNFHPDRGQILASLRGAGVYRSQFETRTSNGALTAHPGGARWLWESRIFGTAYDDADAHERPKYGALNYKRSPYGAAPRFGSAFLRLGPSALARTSVHVANEPPSLAGADRVSHQYRTWINGTTTIHSQGDGM